MRLVKFASASFLSLKGAYSGTTIGVLWQPISVSFVVLFLFLVFNSPEGTPTEYLLYLCAGYWIWQWFSMLLGDGADQFRSQRVHLERPSWSLIDFFVWCTVDRLTRHFIATFFLSLVLVFVGGLTAIGFMLLSYALILVVDVLVSFLLSSVTLVFKDFRFALGLLNRVLFFVTPIFWGYNANPTPGSFRAIATEWSPIANFITGFRYALGVTSLSPSWLVISGWLVFLCVAVCCILMLAPRDWRNYQ